MILMHVMTCQNCKGIGGSQPISDRLLNSLFSELHLLDTLYGTLKILEVKVRYWKKKAECLIYFPDLKEVLKNQKKKNILSLIH